MRRPPTFLLVVATLTLVHPVDAGEITQEPVTFSRDVAPILHEHCVVCHRPGAIGPFSLTTFADVRIRAQAVADATLRRVMPPWQPDPEFSRFQSERLLTDAEIEVLQRWAATGTAEGDSADAPSLPQFDDGWQLGEPDLVITPTTAFTLEAGSAAVYRNFTMPTSLTERRWVKVVDLRPGSTGVIHHARILLDATGEAQDADAEDPQPGYGGMMVDPAGFPEGHFLGWSFGQVPTVISDALSWPLDPGTDIVLQLQLRPGDAPVDVQPSIGFYFSDAAPTFTPISIRLNSKTINIPAGAANHVVENQYRLPVAADVLAVYPHAHFLGKQVEGTATLPDGRTVPLIRINDWDLNWQDEYRFVEPIHLPADTVLRMRFVLDNSSDNPRNPSSPPQPVTTSSVIRRGCAPDRRTTCRTRDWLRDTSRWERLTWPSSSSKQPSATHRTTPRLTTTSARRCSPRGKVTRPSRPIVAPSRSSPITPKRTTASGGLFEIGGNLIDATAHYRLAIQFDRRNFRAHFNLGHVMQTQGATEQAAAHYEEALRPRDTGTLQNLGRVSVTLRRYDIALDHYLSALSIDPNLVS